MSEAPPFFLQLADLASERLGGKVLLANDDFFAPKENLLKESKPIFLEGKYTSRGKWMDGWETRRRRTPGYDWCILRLGLPGIIRGVVVDTSFFTGNFPEQFSLEGCTLGSHPPYRNEIKRLNEPTNGWIELLPTTQLRGDSRNILPIDKIGRFTHLRLKIYPDGGVARLRVHGEAVPDPERLGSGEIDLVAVENGGSIVTSNDQFYGSPRNMLMPGRGKNMGDGWETRRRRGPGHDWTILKLGEPGTIHRVIVDTAHFKGNFPDRCSLEGCSAVSPAGAEAFEPDKHDWKAILPETKLKANHIHSLNKVNDVGVVTHVRFNIYPDGGVSRLRLFGRVDSIFPAKSKSDAAIQKFNRASTAAAERTLLDCCGSRSWASQIARQRPFGNLAQLLDASDRVWLALKNNDWLEAFSHHPPIGAKRGTKPQSTKARNWSKGEQSQAQKASPEALEALAEMNRLYSDRFGYVFLICATGKSTDEIANALQQRLSNEPETELRIAAEEQRKITRLRLEKLFST